MLEIIIVLLYFTVGWHYSKQTFGCMMVYAKLDNYKISAFHRNLIRYSLLGTWWLTWLYRNCSEGSYSFYDLTIYRLDLPYVWFEASYILVRIMFSALFIVFIMNYIQQRKIPSINF